jgi:hypothetical protein
MFMRLSDPKAVYMAEDVKMLKSRFANGWMDDLFETERP